MSTSKSKSLDQYRHLFPPATGIDHTVKRGAKVSDTVKFMPKAAWLCEWMVKDFVEQELKGLSVYDACYRLWHWVKNNIEYKKDEIHEQIKSCRRLVKDGQGDCDCQTNFVNSSMNVYFKMHKTKDTTIINRITGYDNGSNFSHIYSLVPDGVGKYIIMDCVWNKFNDEKPYTNKEDHPMDLQFLDGVNDAKPTRISVDALALSGLDEDLNELGKLLKRSAKNNGGGGKKPTLFKKPLIQKKSPEQKQKAKEKRKTIGKKIVKGVHVVNKANPATVLLRAGILASMKLNVLKVAEKLKWAYATAQFAEEKGMDMSKYPKVKDILTKTEKIFYTAGGKPENLKKAILTGHGNRNHEVAGMDGFDENTPLSIMLGEVYKDEFIDGMEGFSGVEGLGDPATGTSLAAASAAMGSLAALLKSIGELFPHKNKRSKGAAPAPGHDPAENPNGAAAASEENQESAGEQQDADITQAGENESPDTSEAEEGESLPAATEDPLEVTPSEDVPTENPEEVNGSLSGPFTSIKDFYTKNRTPITVAAVAVGLGILFLSAKNLYEDSKKSEDEEAFNGTEQKKPRKKKGGSRQNTTGKISVIALK